MADYNTKPGLAGWSYDNIDVARQRLIWWLATHGGNHGNVYRGSKKMGSIDKIDSDWIWSPKGTATAYKVNSANGNLSTKVE